MVCFKIPERTTSRTLPGGIKDVELFCSPSVVTLSSALVIASTFMSFGDTHGISPFQYAKFSLLGVPPPENRAIYLSLRSEERRVGKECRYRRWTDHDKKT